MGAKRYLEGDEVKRKVDCQECGGAKREGERCEDCGWPIIELERTEDGRMLMFLPLCPSTNARQQPAFRGRGMVLTDDARDYIASVSDQLREMLKKAAEAWGWKPISRYQAIELWLILRTSTSDCHNYGKVLFDALEAGGFVWNDKYLLPLYRGVFVDSKQAAIIIKS
jgi:hypothetical protein